MTFMEQASYINEVMRELKNINESLAILVKNQSCPPADSLRILHHTGDNIKGDPFTDY